MITSSYLDHFYNFHNNVLNQWICKTTYTIKLITYPGRHTKYSCTADAKFLRFKKIVSVLNKIKINDTIKYRKIRRRKTSIKAHNSRGKNRYLETNVVAETHQSRWSILEKHTAITIIRNRKYTYYRCQTII